jgi:hypothetical protein
MSAETRPSRPGEVLDRAFALYRRHFTLFFLLAFLPQLPIALFWLLAPSLLRQGTTLGGDLAFWVAPSLVAPFNIFAIVLAMAALTHALARAIAGETPAFGDALRAGLRRWVPLAAATVIAWVLIALGLVLFVVPGLLLLAMWFAIYPVAVLEGRSALGALKRSNQLASGARMRILGLTAAAWVIALAPMAVLWLVVGMNADARAVMAGGAASESTVRMLTHAQAGSTLLSSLTWPFLMAVTLLLYYDRRAAVPAAAAVRLPAEPA